MGVRHIGYPAVVAVHELQKVENTSDVSKQSYETSLQPVVIGPQPRLICISLIGLCLTSQSRVSVES